MDIRNDCAAHAGPFQTEFIDQFARRNSDRILEDAPGLTDQQVLQLAKKEKRIVVTLDHDFGTLVFRDSKRHVGVLFLRLKKENTVTVIRVIISVFAQYGSKLKGRFTVASESSIRIR